MARKLVFGAAALLGASPLHAADDTQIWTTLSASVDVSKRVAVTLEGQLRLTDDASRIGHTVFRPSVGYKLNKHVTAALGYVYTHADPAGRASSNEHRFWQQIAFRVAGNGKGVAVTGRTRLEQRWMRGADDMGWRLRQQLRAAAPLAGKVRAHVWTEAFVTLDKTSWGQRGGLERWRNSVGVTVPVAQTITLEPGYIHQRIFMRGADRIYHVGSMTLSAKF